MEDAGGVRVGKRVGDLNPEVDRAPRIDRAPGDHAIEHLPRDELEGQKHTTLIVAYLVQCRDVGMGQDHGRARVAQKPLAQLVVCGNIGGQQLEGDSPAELGIAGAINLAYPARSNPVQDFVLPQRLEHG